MNHLNNVNDLMEKGEFRIAEEDQKVVPNQTKSIPDETMDGTGPTPIEEITASSTSKRYF
jgi:hypothetical protein